MDHQFKNCLSRKIRINFIKNIIGKIRHILEIILDM
jgi:hypothetical protein